VGFGQEKILAQMPPKKTLPPRVSVGGEKEKADVLPDNNASLIQNGLQPLGE